MKIQGQFEIIDKQTKQGTTADGRDWKMTEYTVRENIDSDQATSLTATASSTLGELKVGAVYDCTLFINSKKIVAKDGLERLFTSFRISNADLIKDAEETKLEDVKLEDIVDDSMPF